jgi:hypothetical protein
MSVAAELASPDVAVARASVEQPSRRPDAETSRPSARTRVRSLACGPLALTLLFSLLGALALQLWRPLFHLTDDNLTGCLPVITEVYRKLWSGHWPFVNDSIFGGNYDLLRDPAAGFGLISPTILAVSWLAPTKYSYLIPDLVSTINLICIAGAFCWFALFMRKRLELPISDAAIVVTSLSYAFTPFNFLVGASWIGFINPQASFPILVAAFFHPSWRKAIPLAAGALLYALFGSHLHPFLFLLLFAGLLASLLAVSQKSARPLIVLAAGAAIMLLVASPLLWRAFAGFSQSDRHESLLPIQASQFNVPLLKLTTSFVLGPLAQLFGPGVRIHYADALFTTALSFALINVPLVCLLFGKRKVSALEWCLIASAVVCIVFLMRPMWLANALAHVPLFKSLRWPFRELGVLAFFSHFLFVLNFKSLSTRALRISSAVGAALLALVFFNPAPSFNTLALDQRLILSGKAAAFWRSIADDTKPQIIVAADPNLMRSHIHEVPFPLLGAYDYASLLGIVNISGYSPTLPASGLQKEIRPYHHSGIFHPVHAAFIASHHPEVMKVTLLSVSPTYIEIAQRDNKRYFHFDATTERITEVALPADPKP